jgi:hypothetical protein
MFKKYQQNKQLIAYLLAALLFTILGIISIYINLLNNESKIDRTPELSPASQEIIEEKEKPVILKEQTYIKVPYTVQAPNGRWDIHEESCEEAAALMYYYYLTNYKNENIPANTAHQEFLKMIDWQKKNYGKEPDLTIKVFGQFFKSYYGHDYKIIESTTKEDIKKTLSAGYPVVVPVMTHSLNNPNYGRQNTYHLLLIKGYNKSGVITNDAGISQGKDYHYNWETLFGAMKAQESTLKQGSDLIYFF